MKYQNLAKGPWTQNLAPATNYHIYNKRNARSLPGVINHYAKAKIMHNVYCAFTNNLRNVIFMCAKYFHGEMMFPTKVIFLLHNFRVGFLSLPSENAQ